MTIDNKGKLIDQLRRGERFDYLPFWGPGEEGAGIGPWIFCQWYPAPFLIDAVRYPTAEHYMMAEKARLFADEESRQRILAAPDPAMAKMLGRAVRGFVEAQWAERRFAIVLNGTLEKFRQNPPLLSYLLATGEAILVEASPLDRLWGAGIGAAHPALTHPEAWPGENLLGFALMAARAQLRHAEQESR